MKAYKVTNKQNRSIVATDASALEYKKGIKVKPNLKGSQIFVFKRKAEALYWAGQIGGGHVWRCEVPKLRRLWYRAATWAASSGIDNKFASFWNQFFPTYKGVSTRAGNYTYVCNAPLFTYVTPWVIPEEIVATI